MAAERVQTWRKKLEDFLNEKNFFTDLLTKIEVKTGVKKLYLFLGILGFLAFWLVFGYAADLIVNLLGFGYPAYCSVKAIESPDKTDDTQWLIYWVVFSTFCIVEFFSDILLSWFPFYFLCKLIFLVWCMAPYSWNGADTIYHRIIKPFVMKHQGKIDEALDKVALEASKAAKEAQHAAAKAAVDAAYAEDEKDK